MWPYDDDCTMGERRRKSEQELIEKGYKPNAYGTFVRGMFEPAYWITASGEIKEKKYDHNF